MSDFREVLMMYEHKAKTILLKMYIDLIIFSTISEIIGRLVFLIKYGMLRIFK